MLAGGVLLEGLASRDARRVRSGRMGREPFLPCRNDEERRVGRARVRGAVRSPELGASAGRKQKTGAALFGSPVRSAAQRPVVSRRFAVFLEAEDGIRDSGELRL